MPKLPTVLMTDCIRSANIGNSHGGAYLVNLEAGSWQKVLDWNDQAIDWEGRGSDRGLRGIAFHNGEIYIAASNELFVFGQDFKIKRSFKNRYLGHCHEMFLDGDTLYLASTLFDSILTFDIPSGQFGRAWMFRHLVKKNAEGGPGGGPPQVQVMTYDASKEKGPQRGDSTHLNMVWVVQGLIYFSGVRINRMLCIDPTKGIRKHANIPTWTHNARPYRGGVLCNSTANDSICHLDLEGKVLKEFPVPRYDEAALTNKPTGEDVARQAFGRGLVTTEDGLIIGGSSPSTITVHDFESGSKIKSVNITLDVRNAPHGLAVWPY